MRNEKYWVRRMQILEESLLDTGYEYVKNLEEQYDRAIRSVEKEIEAWYGRFAANQGITLAEAKKLLTTDELEEFRWDVNEYIRRGRENAVTKAWMKQLENASARVHVSRFESLKLHLQQQAEMLHAAQQETLNTALTEVYERGYYHTAFEIQKGIGVGWSLHGITEDAIRKVLSRPWTLDGKTFSDRIWANKETLVNSVTTELTQMLMRGSAPDKAIKAIVGRFGVSKSQAGRLVMTESAAFANEARRDCFKALDVEQYVIVETLDGETCSLCGSLDGKVYPMSEYQIGVTAPPFHPWCRGTTAPYFADLEGIGERYARDVKTGENFTIPKDMTYDDWKSKQNEVYGDGAVEKSRKIRYNESADKKQYESYKNRLGDEAPKSFKAFQQLKYDNPEQYKDLTGYYQYRGYNPSSDKRFYEANKAVKALYDSGKIRATGTLVSPPQGRLIVEPNPHAMNTFTKRGITQADAQEIIDNAIFALKQRQGTQYAFYTEKGYAVLRNDGLLTSLGWLDEGGRLLYDEVIKHVEV